LPSAARTEHARDRGMNECVSFHRQDFFPFAAPAVKHFVQESRVVGAGGHGAGSASTAPQRSQT
jgi:hypothetical protein